MGPDACFLELADATIAYRVFGAGDPIILVHSGTGSGLFDWRHQIPVLSAEHRVIVPDLRGHADSSAAPLSLATLTADLEALGERLGAFPAHLVGASHGSFPVISLALERPEWVRSVAIVGSVWCDDHLPPDVDDEIVARWPGALRRLHAQHGEDHWEDLLRELIRDRRRNVRLSEADFARVQAPLLVVQGDRDPFLEVHLSAAAAFAAPRGELLVLPGTGHAPHIESSRLFNEAYLRFLAKATSRDPSSAAAPTPTTGDLRRQGPQ